MPELPLANNIGDWSKRSGKMSNRRVANITYVEVRDENGNRIVGQLRQSFGAMAVGRARQKTRLPGLWLELSDAFAGNAYSVKVEGLPSDVLSGAFRLGDLNLRFHRIHVAYLLVYQKTTKQ